jgi:L-alanine-DL-glutamate epimerase-like enolase superfamily enzyme
VKIDAVEVHRVLIPAANPPFIWRRGLPGSPPDGYGAVLRIRTDDGCEGVALAPRYASSAILPDIVDRVLRSRLVGEDPLRREWLWHQLWEIDRVEEIPLYLLGTVDTALWDLAGRAAGLPTWQLLGGYRTEIPAYASTTTFSDVEEFLDVADQCLELGYPAIKLHAFGDARRDAELCTALREHVGEKVELMYDGSAGFDLADAVYVGRALSDAGYLWYEEPIREFSITSYKWLAERVAVGLLVGETSDGAHMNTADFIASGCATFVRTSAELRGGFTGAMRTAHLADAFRLRAEPHGPTVTSRQLCMAIPNCTYYESLVTSNPAKREWGIDDHGVVHAPGAPGIGLQPGPLYPPELEQYVVQTGAEGAQR